MMEWLSPTGWFAALGRQWLLYNLENPQFRFMFAPPPPNEWVALDCETTGLNVNTDEIISIAAVRIVGNRNECIAPEEVRPVEPFEALQTPWQKRDCPAVARCQARRGNPDRQVASQFIRKHPNRFRPCARTTAVVAGRADLTTNHGTLRADKHTLNLRAAEVDADRSAHAGCNASNLRFRVVITKPGRPRTEPQRRNFRNKIGFACPEWPDVCIGKSVSTLLF